ncbi:hypothetical protein, partial [Cupriavidus basilensis]|uniref:hypothetical protein n=1 Tax=Cupriavidus basilensis TaxID=68895 RepID=UPI0023E76707
QRRVTGVPRRGMSYSFGSKTNAAQRNSDQPQASRAIKLPDIGDFAVRPERMRASAGTGLTSHDPASFQAMQHRWRNSL